MYKREIEKTISRYLKEKDDKKILFIWGPRRAGKTTLMKKLANGLGVDLYNFDLVSDQDKFVPRYEVLKKVVRENGVILIDEIQNYPESTQALKILHDVLGVKVIATGSSELRQKSRDFDSLAGRYREIYCLPLAITEILTNEEEVGKEQIHELQIFGCYPEILTNKDLAEKEKIELLQNILEAYVLKDVINIYELKNIKLAHDILLKIALQIGSEVSVREIANSLSAYPSTVSNYIEIFIKNHILIPLPSFKTNARRAVSENRKLFFADLGIRNILVQDFRELKLRPDRGGVFENLVVAEIEKWRKIRGVQGNLYFYREYGGKEIDLIIEDYKKNYLTIEIKVKSGISQKIFPLPHKQMIITEDNLMESMGKLVA